MSGGVQHIQCGDCLNYYRRGVESAFCPHERKTQEEVDVYFRIKRDGARDVASGPQPPSAPSAIETQVGGEHYKKLGRYQPWEVLKRWLTWEEFRGYMKGEAIVYLAREPSKGGRQDIEKAMHVLQGYLELTAGEEQEEAKAQKELEGKRERYQKSLDWIVSDGTRWVR